MSRGGVDVLGLGAGSQADRVMGKSHESSERDDDFVRGFRHYKGLGFSC